ncbi:MAG: sulfotransferase [Pseudomonadota bacterium]
MTTQKFHFISGLPRAGSTLLAALLLQNPRFHAGMTSPIGSLLSAVLAQVSAGSEFSQAIDKEQRQALLQGLFESFYKKEKDKNVIFDTNRLWCAKLSTVLDLFPDAKIIACVRNVAWIMDSIERRYRANPYENTLLFGSNMGRSTVYTRLEGLAKHDQLVGFAWSALREAFYGDQARSLLIVDYELLAHAPHKVMPLIYDFIGEPHFAHDFDNVEYDAPDFDWQLGMPGLHRVQPKVEFKPRPTIIPPDLFEKYSQMSFWNDTAGSAAHVISKKN